MCVLYHSTSLSFKETDMCVYDFCVISVWLFCYCYV